MTSGVPAQARVQANTNDVTGGGILQWRVMVERCIWTRRKCGISCQMVVPPELASPPCQGVPGAECNRLALRELSLNRAHCASYHRMSLPLSIDSACAEFSSDCSLTFS